MLVITVGNCGFLLAYTATYRMAYKLVPSLTTFVSSHKEAQTICYLPTTKATQMSNIMKWFYTVATTAGFILLAFSNYLYSPSSNLVLAILMYSFKIIMAVFVIHTFDTLYKVITMEFQQMVKRFDDTTNTKDKLVLVSCMKTQFSTIQNGFGDYFLLQFSFVTFAFVLFSYNFVIQLMYLGKPSIASCINIIGTLIVIITNLLKMAFIAFSTEWITGVVLQFRNRLVEEKEKCEAKEYERVKFIQKQYFFEETPTFFFC